MGKWIATLLILAATIGGMYYFNHYQNTNLEQQASQTLQVQVFPVASYTIHDEIEALGTAFANEAVDVTANSTDKLIEIKFEDGQKVKQGDILAILDQAEEQAQLGAARSQVEENERELKRLSNLLKSNAAAKNEYDARQTLLIISKSRVDEIQARINDKIIQAPFDGVLGLRKVSVGSLVEPGSLITTIDDISQIKLDFSVPSVFLDVVHEGLPIEAQSNAINKIFRGKITKISSRVNPITRSVVVRAILPNPEEILKPGLLLSVTLFRNKREALMIPEESLIQLQNKSFVYVTENNMVVQKEIQIGKQMAGWVEVTGGLNSGDQVMTRGQIRTRPGQEVTIEILEKQPQLREMSE